jgi:hypothetical protein
MDKEAEAMELAGDHALGKGTKIWKQNNLGMLFTVKNTDRKDY